MPFHRVVFLIIHKRKEAFKAATDFYASFCVMLVEDKAIEEPVRMRSKHYAEVYHLLGLLDTERYDFIYNKLHEKEVEA